MKVIIQNSFNLILHSLLLLAILTGCCASSGVIRFSNLQHPASMSAFLFDQNQNVVMKGRELETVHVFKIKKTFWSLFYGALPITKEAEISDSMNELIEKYGGDGIINLTVTIEQGTVNKFYSFLLYLPPYIPFLPGSADISISGEIVKLKSDDSSL